MAKAEGGGIIPTLRYRNARAAIDWLGKAFGFEAKMVVPGDGERIAHAELVLGNGMIMLGDAETEYGHLVAAPFKGQSVTQGLYVVVADVDGHYARAKTEGAEIVLEHQDAGLWRAGLYVPRSRRPCLDLRHLRSLGELTAAAMEKLLQWLPKRPLPILVRYGCATVMVRSASRSCDGSRRRAGSAASSSCIRPSSSPRCCSTEGRAFMRRC